MHVLKMGYCKIMVADVPIQNITRPKVPRGILVRLVVCHDRFEIFHNLIIAAFLQLRDGRHDCLTILICVSRVGFRPCHEHAKAVGSIITADREQGIRA